MFFPTVELIEERIVPCCTPVHCTPPTHCEPVHCQPVCQPICQPVQHCQPIQHCQQPVVNGGAQATNISYIINGQTPVTSLTASNLHSGDTVEVVFSVPPGSKPTTFSFVSYTATGDFNLPDQKVYDAAEVTTCGGGTYSLKINVPCGYFQVDFVQGGPINHFIANGETYHGDNRYLGGTTGGTQMDCKCMDNYFCDHHQDCHPTCNVTNITNITNNTYNTYNNITNNTYNNVTNNTYNETTNNIVNNEITNNYSSMLNSLVQNNYSLNYTPPQQQLNNNFNFGTTQNIQMSNTGYTSSHENPPNIHDIVGPTVMGGTDDIQLDKDKIQKYLNPNGDKPLMSPFDAQPQVPLVVPCQPVPQNCPPVPCQR